MKKEFLLLFASQKLKGKSTSGSTNIRIIYRSLRRKIILIYRINKFYKIYGIKYFIKGKIFDFYENVKGLINKV